MIKRESYLEIVRPLMNKPFIKVLTGIRRCGKSSLLQQIRDELLENKVSSENIIYLNFESFENSTIVEAKTLYLTIKSKIEYQNTYYILLDEIQEIKDWEKAVNSMMTDFNVDIYITGSNSKLLSSELATYIAGRYVEINVSTLSFTEYLNFKQVRTKIEKFDIRKEFEQYLRLGGFPAIHTSEYQIETVYQIVNDIYSSVILRDTIHRHNIRNLELLERVVKFVFDNIGSKFSAKNIADYFKSQYRKVDIETIYNYLNALEGAFIIQRLLRYDIKGREILQTNEKYYVGDQSLIYSVMGYKDRMISGILENIVMLELKRRGYKVFVGKLDECEIDFIAQKANQKIYVQVAYKLTEEQTVNREFTPLTTITDNYPKYVVTMDELWSGNIEGVEHKHIADFLTMKF